MVITKRPRSKPHKRERIRTHIEELKQLILSKHPKALFDIGPVPDIRWPGLYVYASINEDKEQELHHFVAEAQERFFRDEWMTVFVFVRHPERRG